MSTQASIDFNLKSLNVNDLISTLVNKGWNLEYQNEIMYLDNDDFDWKIEKHQGLDEILNKLSASSSSIVGIVLVNSKLDSGGNFLFFKESNTLSLTISINRIKTMEKWTAFNTYLKELGFLYSMSTTLSITETR